MADTIYQALQAGDFGSPSCTSICASLNLLGKLGWIEIAGRGQPPSDRADMNTETPPGFLLDAFRFDEKEGGDGPRDL